MRHTKAGSILSLILSVGLIASGCNSKSNRADERMSVLEASLRQDPPAEEVTINHRLVAIDNVCAWPNLTVLEDGTIIATIFNQPSHARTIGDVECWASQDGHFWEKRGTPAQHDPMANRMNVAAGLANNKDMIVIASGWSLESAEKSEEYPHEYNLDAVLRPWVSRSSDGGKTWTVGKDAFPVAEEGMTEFIPFGDILPGADGSLRALAYAQSEDKVTNKVSMFGSDDDGKTWKLMSVISDGFDETEFSKGHNETAFFYLGKGQWIAAARRWKAGAATDLFRSNDDGKTWTLDGPLTQEHQHPAHILQLNDGRLILTYGNRIPGNFGVAVKVSEDGGKTWGDEKQVVNDLLVGDAGYPASVQRADGKIVTAYYAREAPNHQRYHMGVVIWEI